MKPYLDSEDKLVVDADGVNRVLVEEPDGEDSHCDDAKHDVDGNAHNPPFAPFVLLGLHRLQQTRVAGSQHVVSWVQQTLTGASLTYQFGLNNVACIHTGCHARTKGGICHNVPEVKI